MRPFRSEDEGLLFGVAKLAFADCDDRRTIATLERDTVFVAELAGQPAGYVAIEESAASAPHRTALCASRPRGGGRRLPAARLGRGLRDLARLGPARGRGRRRERPRRRVLPRPRVRPGRAGSSSRSFCRRLCSLAVVLAALALPAAASAHARLVGSKPADGAVLATAPATCALLFDDEIRPAGGDRARRRARPLGARRRTASPATTARSLVLPLRPGLPHGAYSVRWRVVSNDGHLISGVLAFAVGAGSPRPVSTLVRGRRDVRPRRSSSACSFSPACSSPAAPRSPARLLGPAGGCETAVVPARACARRRRRLRAARARARRRRHAVRPRDGDRGDRRRSSGVAAALASIAIPAARARRVRGRRARARRADARRPRARPATACARSSRSPTSSTSSAPRSGSAAWRCSSLGAQPPARRASRRSRVGAVAVLGGAAIPRALAAFPSLASVVHTGYGQAVLVKTGLLAAVLALAWANRRRIARARPRRRARAARRSWSCAVAVLTDLRPPARARRAAAPCPAVPAPPPRDARRARRRGRRRRRRARRLAARADVAARVTALGPDGKGVDGLQSGSAGSTPTPAGRAAIARRSRFRRAPTSRSQGRARSRPTLRFTLPARWPAPRRAALVTRSTARSARSARSSSTSTSPRARATPSTPSTAWRRRTA